MNEILSAFGLCLVNRQALLHWDVCLRRLKGLGFDPKTVIDIGVAHGTPDLYRVFSDAYFILIDPLREAVPFMKEHCRSFDGGGNSITWHWATAKKHFSWRFGQSLVALHYLNKLENEP